MTLTTLHKMQCYLCGSLFINSVRPLTRDRKSLALWKQPSLRSTTGCLCQDLNLCARSYPSLNGGMGASFCAGNGVRLLHVRCTCPAFEPSKYSVSFISQGKNVKITHLKSVSGGAVGRLQRHFKMNNVG